ncbi:hypothetical protein HOH11_02435 [Candidatus Woesearchaeota archaeon]|jgi:hypothetical protein|nr:hypothetical protein [Candidatus Woesearchaeota archaeon]MBT6023432.1 hypothetical protein [Candidatus Woesearchaeota archaeon]
MDEQINLKYELEIINSSESRKSLKLNEHYEQTYLELAVEKFYSSFFQRKSFWKHTGLEQIMGFNVKQLLHDDEPATTYRGNNRKGIITINPSCSSVKRRLEEGNEHAGLFGAVMNLSRIVAHELTHQNNRNHNKEFYKESEEVAYKLIPSIIRYFPKYCKSRIVEFKVNPKIDID